MEMQEMYRVPAFECKAGILCRTPPELEHAWWPTKENKMIVTAVAQPPKDIVLVSTNDKKKSIHFLKKKSFYFI